MMKGHNRIFLPCHKATKTMRDIRSMWERVGFIRLCLSRLILLVNISDIKTHNRASGYEGNCGSVLL